MSESGSLIGPIGILFMGVYLLSLVILGWLGRQSQQENTLSDFYLGGRQLGFLVLFLTLYATQYSGNTLIGFSGSGYREGFRFLVSFTFMAGVIGGVMIYAPKLQRLSKKYAFITPADFVQHRFGLPRLSKMVSALSIIALANYILSNLMAMGLLVETATGGKVSFAAGVVLLSIVMVIYETLGGMRSVAWSDMLQGGILLVGCAIIFTVVMVHYGGTMAVAEYFASERPSVWHSPTWEQKRTWASTLLLVFFGIPLYPHMVQRVYAAKDAKVLKRSLQWMAVMPFVTTLLMVLVGIVGNVRFPGLEKQASERIILFLLQDLGGAIPSLKALLVVFVAAAVAAIMSTVDSALLSISSMFTQDFYRGGGAAVRTEAHLTRVGKIASWTVMGLMTGVALLVPSTIWALVQIKLELLCQMAPAVFLGLHSRLVGGKEVWVGLCVGVAIAAFLTLGAKFGLSVEAKPWGVHSGIWGLIGNLGCVAFGYGRRKRGLKRWRVT